jgi:predicted amidohydrolase
MRFAVATRRIGAVLAPLASNTVTTIVGFTELADDARLYNSAAVLYRGRVAGVYRKRHPAIRRSVYAAGADTPVVRLDGSTFGVVICYDSNFFESALRMAVQGATVLFVPTNNGLPHSRAEEYLAAQAREADVARATENNLWFIRADVAGRTSELVSGGSSEIVRPDGTVLLSAREFVEETVHDYLQRAESAGIKWPLPEGHDDEHLESPLFRQPTAPVPARKAGQTGALRRI